MNKWVLVFLLSCCPCFVLAGNTIEEVNRSAAASGMATQAENISGLEEARALAAGDFDGRNARVVTADPRLKEKLATEQTMVNQRTGEAYTVTVGGVPAVSEAQDVSVEGKTTARQTQNAGNYAPVAAGAQAVSNARGRVSSTASQGRGAGQHNAQTSVNQQEQKVITSTNTGKNGGGVYFPGRKGQGGLGSKVPMVPASNGAAQTGRGSVRGAATQTAAVEEEAPQEVQPVAQTGRGSMRSTTRETVSTDEEVPAEVRRIAEAGVISNEVTMSTSQARDYQSMTPEERSKWAMCMRQQMRAKRARAAGITIDIGACENMELDKIQTSHTLPSQKELDARADALAAQSLRNAKQEQQQAAQKAKQAAAQDKKRAAQDKKRAAQKKKLAAAQAKKLRKANKTCGSYTYDDICVECCGSFGIKSANLEYGYCVCR